MIGRDIREIKERISRLRSYVPYDEQWAVDQLEGDFENLFHYTAALESANKSYAERGFYARHKSEGD